MFSRDFTIFFLNCLLLCVQQGKGKEEEMPEEEEEELEEEELLEDEEDDVEPEKRWEMERESIAMANMAAELQVSSSPQPVHVVYTHARRLYVEDEPWFCFLLFLEIALPT